MHFDGFGNWITVGKSENLSLARITYNKLRKARETSPVILVQVLEFNKNDDAILGDDIQEQKELEYDI
jgi:hypothetical protein